MNSDYQAAKCGKCGVILSEPKNAPRSPCPVCGEKGRVHEEALAEEINFGSYRVLRSYCRLQEEFHQRT
jgi:DNA-directed RNA polymerase subunit RPC12/RpoP